MFNSYRMSRILVTTLVFGTITIQAAEQKDSKKESAELSAYYKQWLTAEEQLAFEYTPKERKASDDRRKLIKGTLAVGAVGLGLEQLSPEPRLKSLGTALKWGSAATLAWNTHETFSALVMTTSHERRTRDRAMLKVSLIKLLKDNPDLLAQVTRQAATAKSGEETV